MHLHQHGQTLHQQAWTRTPRSLPRACFGSGSNREQPGTVREKGSHGGAAAVRRSCWGRTSNIESGGRQRLFARSGISGCRTPSVVPSCPSARSPVAPVAFPSLRTAGAGQAPPENAPLSGTRSPALHTQLVCDSERQTSSNFPKFISSPSSAGARKYHSSGCAIASHHEPAAVINTQ
jgi:hypothetical protein